MLMLKGSVNIQNATLKNTTGKQTKTSKMLPGSFRRVVGTKSKHLRCKS